MQFLSVFGEVAHHAVGIRSGQGDDNLRPGIYVVSCDGRRFGRLRIELYDEDVAVAQDEVFEGARIDTRNVELRFHLIEHRNGFEQYRTERVAHFAVPELLVDGYDYLVRFSAGVVEIARAALRFAGEHQAAASRMAANSADAVFFMVRWYLCSVLPLFTVPVPAAGDRRGTRIPAAGGVGSL